MPELIERPTLDYAVVCDDIRFEMADKISLMGLFDSINVQSFPTVHPRLSVVAAWVGLQGEAISEIRLVDPSGSVIGRLGVAHLKETGEKKGARHIAVTYNVPFKAPGTHEIKIYLNSELMRSIPFPVRSVGISQTAFGSLGTKR
jgi:hypothetical protein